MPDPSDNQRWADLLVDELVRCGVDRFCLAPGSRSTPLVVAVARHPGAHAVVHFDERGTAFYALGYARGAGRPAAWITTSGTAVANGMPAVVEASSDGVGMVLLTADRPPELRETGANQTVVQPGLFGGYVRWSFDLPAPAPGVDPSFLLTTVDQAVHRAAAPPAGPVHLNAMYREPLAPPPGARPTDRAGESGGRPFTVYGGGRTAADPAAVEAVAAAVRGARRGLVVAGRLRRPDEAAAAEALARALGWPLLPDVLSGARFGRAADGPHVPNYDALLHARSWAAAHRPDAVVYLGRPAVSKRLLGFLAEARPETFVVVDDGPGRLDPSHQATHRIHADVAAFAAALAEAAGGAGEGEWMNAWRSASRRAEDALAAAFDEVAGADAPDEPWVARRAAAGLPEGHGLYLAASMPIRDVDAFGRADGPAIRVAANRGASGIDGTLASAAGFADGTGRPVTVLTGDLAFLHDLNSLALVRTRPIVVVAVNNGGGGIFSFLPIAERTDVFEPYFETPHDLTFGDAAAMFGIPYHRIEASRDFERAYAAAVRSGRPAVIEVRTDRRANRDRHAALAERVASAVERSVD